MTFDAGPMSAGRILIVDDEPANVRLLERLLKTGGFTTIRSTTDSREAMPLVEEFNPDLIMLDLNMPNVDGFDILRELSARNAPNDFLPVIALTTDMTLATKERALSNGATDFLVKPFERTEVLLRTKNLLQSRQLHLGLRNENRILESRLAHQAFHDSLTNLANRALFRDRIEHALARAARGAKSALLMIDLDDFKAVNDSIGHGEGDRLLKIVAENLVLVTRDCDTVARLGGDEFAILLDDIRKPDDARIVIDRIMESMRQPIVLESREVTIGVSIGVAHANVGDRVDELLRNADVAMYRAKAEGKGRHAVFEPSMYSTLIERLELQSDLRNAVGRAELRVLYQPIIDLRSGAITGVEALVRWHRAALGETQPDTFIPVAEETGLIVPIGRWVLAEAARQATEWQGLAGAAGLPMSVNVSARQLHDSGFTTDVATVLAETRLPPDRLTLEITETVLVSSEVAMDRLRDLKALGVRLAIDDFGTGYSNLSALQRLPLDIIKIDRSFIMSTGGNAVLTSIIIDMATTLKLQTVAEGIEHASQRQHLLGLGCSLGQGYLFSKPITADAITALLKGQADQAGGTAFGAIADASAAEASSGH